MMRIQCLTSIVANLQDDSFAYDKNVYNIVSKGLLYLNSSWWIVIGTIMQRERMKATTYPAIWLNNKTLLKAIVPSAIA